MLMWDAYVLALCFQFSGFIFASTVPEFCDQARNNCLSRISCQIAFRHFMMGCEEVIYGGVNTCTTKCKNALISLLSTEDGAGLAFVNCNCSGVEYCETRKRRVEVCAMDVMDFMNNMDDHGIVSCSLARWVCEVDTSCMAALDYYIRHCAKLVNGGTCTARCNNSLDILYRQTRSKMLQTCVCDGTEEYDCQALKDNTERLCLNRQPKVAYSTVSRGISDASPAAGSPKTSSCRILSIILQAFVILILTRVTSPGV